MSIITTKKYLLDYIDTLLTYMQDCDRNRNIYSVMRFEIAKQKEQRKANKMFDIHGFVESQVVRSAFQVLENGVELQFLIDEVSFEVKKTDGKIESSQKDAPRPFLIFIATSGAMNLLSASKNPKDFGKRFAEMYAQKSIDIKFMAPPGTALTYGVLAMLNRIGLKPNLL